MLGWSIRKQQRRQQLRFMRGVHSWHLFDWGGGKRVRTVFGWDVWDGKRIQHVHRLRDRVVHHRRRHCVYPMHSWDVLDGSRCKLLRVMHGVHSRNFLQRRSEHLRKVRRWLVWDWQRSQQLFVVPGLHSWQLLHGWSERVRGVLGGNIRDGHRCEYMHRLYGRLVWDQQRIHTVSPMRCRSILDRSRCEELWVVLGVCSRNLRHGRGKCMHWMRVWNVWVQ
mmetsp:Transcript_53237/g.140878  ORF Transcript_53237/g.140878 Transcript_53237/m.140878 type:complete len:222 (-) Transcript_53237:3060-3725(-)